MDGLPPPGQLPAPQHRQASGSAYDDVYSMWLTACMGKRPVSRETSPVRRSASPPIRQPAAAVREYECVTPGEWHNVRAAPHLEAEQLSRIRRNEVVHVTDTYPDNTGSVWGRVGPGWAMLTSPEGREFLREREVKRAELEASAQASQCVLNSTLEVARSAREDAEALLERLHHQQPNPASMISPQVHGAGASMPSPVPFSIASPTALSPRAVALPPSFPAHAPAAPAPQPVSHVTAAPLRVPLPTKQPPPQFSPVMAMHAPSIASLPEPSQLSPVHNEFCVASYAELPPPVPVQPPTMEVPPVVVPPPVASLPPASALPPPQAAPNIDCFRALKDDQFLRVEELPPPSTASVELAELAAPSPVPVSSTPQSVMSQPEGVVPPEMSFVPVPVSATASTVDPLPHVQSLITRDVVADQSQPAPVVGDADPLRPTPCSMTPTSPSATSAALWELQVPLQAQSAMVRDVVAADQSQPAPVRGEAPVSPASPPAPYVQQVTPVSLVPSSPVVPTSPAALRAYYYDTPMSAVPSSPGVAAPMQGAPVPVEEVRYAPQEVTSLPEATYSPEPVPAEIPEPQPQVVQITPCSLPQAVSPRSVVGRTPNVLPETTPYSPVVTPYSVPAVPVAVQEEHLPSTVPLVVPEVQRPYMSPKREFPSGAHSMQLASGVCVGRHIADRMQPVLGIEKVAVGAPPPPTPPVQVARPKTGKKPATPTITAVTAPMPTATGLVYEPVKLKKPLVPRLSKKATGGSTTPRAGKKPVTPTAAQHAASNVKSRTFLVDTAIPVQTPKQRAVKRKSKPTKTIETVYSTENIKCIYAGPPVGRSV